MFIHLQKNRKGFSVAEVMVVCGAGAFAITAFMKYQANLTRRNLENAAKISAQMELDDFALQLRKDFERHSNVTNSLTLVPSPAPFVAPSSGQPCGNLTILQTMLGTSGNYTIKIEYQTQCANQAAPPSTDIRRLIHPELSATCDSHSPSVSRAFYSNSSATTATSTQSYPSSAIKSLSMCIRPDALPAATKYLAELSAAYQSADGSWKVIQKTLTLLANEFGTADIEILPPQ